MIVVSLKLFPLLESSLHLSGSFYLYCGVLMCGLPLIMLVLPETKDLSICQINTIFVNKQQTARCCGAAQSPEQASQRKGIKDYGSRNEDCPRDLPTPDPPSCLHSSLGLLLALLSGILLTTFSALLKIVTMDPMQVAVIRGGLQSLIMGFVAIYKNQSFKGEI